MLGGGSELKKGFPDIFFFFFFFLEAEEVSCTTCSHRGAIWLCSFKPGAIPISQTLSASGFGRVSHAANQPGVSSSHLNSPGSRRDWLFLGTTESPCLKAKG